MKNPLYPCVFLGLIMFLFSPFSGAQQQRFIDTQQDCAAQGGSWESSHNDWLHSCMLPLQSQGECDGKGGHLVSRVNAQSRCEIDTSSSAQKRQCAANGGSWGKHGAMSDYCYFKAKEKECLAKSGVWKQAGMMGRYICITPAIDAGKPCKGKEDCNYGCEYKGSDLVTRGQRVEGRCRSTSDPFGCWTWVEGGMVVGRFCTD